jgi:hypothetical protein
VGLKPLSELAVFPARARHDANETPATAVDVVHRLTITELGVSDIEEIYAAGRATQRLPGVFMGARVVGVAMLAAKLHGDAAVVTGGEDKEQLFEVGAMVFRVAIGDKGGTLAPKLSGAGLSVLTTEAHGGRIVVQLIELEVEPLHRADDHLGQ